MTFYLGGSTLLLIAGLLLTYWIHAQRQLEITVEAAAAPDDCPLISVCVPARNEARTISACIDAVLAQDYPRLEVIAVDDESSDTTPQILEALKRRFPELTVLEGAPLPPGWAGKPFALHQAVGGSRGSWLCFLDADTVLRPEALASCYAKAAQTRADLFTIMTRQVTITFWEKVLMPVVFTALAVGFPSRRVNDPDLPDAVANGQFMLMRREAYEAVGGHAAIKDRIVDDQAMAELIKRSGHRLVLADGTSLARTRMYTSLPEMWEGWTKNIYLGLRDRPATLILGVLGAAFFAAAALLLPLWPLAGAFLLEGGAGWSAAIIIGESLVVWGAALYARGAMAHAMGIGRLYAFTTPLGCGLFAAMMLTSAWKVLSGRGVTWRGRTYHNL